MTAALAAAVVELRSHRVALQAELERTDKALAVLETLVEPPASDIRPPTPDTPPARLTPAQSAGFESSRPDVRRAARQKETSAGDDRVRAILRDRGGKMSSGEMQRALKLPKVRWRRYSEDLIARGVIVATGATSGRRLALPGAAAAAKEEP